MKRTLCLIVMLSLFAGCVQETAQETEETTTTTLKETGPTTTITEATTTTTATASTTTTTTTTSTSTTLPAEKSAAKLELSLNKDLFRSGELVTMEVKITSEKMMTDADVHVYGIYASKYRLNETVAADIVPGENKITFTYTAPSCNTCAGIKAGKYAIEAELIYLGKAVARDRKDIEIRQ